MKIVVLTENTKCREDLGCEHGLSLYIETGCCRILFDMGQTALFAENAAQLGIDLAEVDFAVLSHGHYDHGGGMEKFLEINKKAPVYLTREAFTPHFNASGKYIGLEQALAQSGRLAYIGDFQEIAPGIALHTCNGLAQPWPADAYGLTAGTEGQPDGFRHEQYLLIEEAGKRICISGCSHKGIRNIVHWFRPDVLVGGFHFMKLDDREKLEEAAGTLLEYDTVYYTGHCTGEKQTAVLKAIMGSRLKAISTGMEIHF